MKISHVWEIQNYHSHESTIAMYLSIKPNTSDTQHVSFQENDVFPVWMIYVQQLAIKYDVVIWVFRKRKRTKDEVALFIEEKRKWN